MSGENYRAHYTRDQINVMFLARKGADIDAELARQWGRSAGAINMARRWKVPDVNWPDKAFNQIDRQFDEALQNYGFAECGRYSLAEAFAKAQAQPRSKRAPLEGVALDRIRVNALNDFCDAHGRNNQSEIKRLAPVARTIGEKLNIAGGTDEMHRILQLVPHLDKRPLEAHWNGIGEWRG